MLMGKLLAHSAITEKLGVIFYPSYGPEMRGGTANCTLIISDQRIGSPVIDRYSFLVAMNQPSLDKFYPHIKTGGMLIYDAGLTCPDDRADLKKCRVPIEDMAKEVGTLQVANMVAVGSYVACMESISQEAVFRSLEKVVPAHRKEMIDINKSAIQKGYDFATKI